MAAWELGLFAFDMRREPTDSYVRAPASWSFDYNTQVQFRAAFWVVNGSGPIATGDIQIQKNVEDAGWEDIESLGARNLQPGHGVAPADFPPDWYEDFITIEDEWMGLNVRFRAVLTWTTDGISDEHTCEIVLDILDGALADFFQTDANGQNAVFLGAAPRRIRCQFDDPSEQQLRIDGARPTLLCAYADVEPVVAGDPVTVASRSFTVREKRRDSDLVLLVLEDAA